MVSMIFHQSQMTAVFHDMFVEIQLRRLKYRLHTDDVGHLIEALIYYFMDAVAVVS